MRDPSESRRSGRCRMLFFQLILAFLCVAAIAQKDPKSNPPKYDLHTEIKIKSYGGGSEAATKRQRERSRPPARKNWDRYAGRLSVPEVLSSGHGRELQQGGRNRSYRFKKLSKAKPTSFSHGKW